MYSGDSCPDVHFAARIVSASLISVSENNVYSAFSVMIPGWVARCYRPQRTILR